MPPSPASSELNPTSTTNINDIHAYDGQQRHGVHVLVLSSKGSWARESTFRVRLIAPKKDEEAPKSKHADMNERGAHPQSFYRRRDILVRTPICSCSQKLHKK